MRWKFLCQFYLKQFIKSKLYITAILLLPILLFIRIGLYLGSEFNYEDFGQLPGEISMLIQMVSIFYMLYFYRSYSKELLYGVQHFFTDGYRILLEKMSSMFVAHAIVQFGLMAFTYIIFIIVYSFVGIEISTYQISLLRFLLVYMFAPLLITALFGIVIAMIFGTKKSGFFAVLFLWIMTGGAAKEVFFDFFSEAHANDWKSLLFLGTNSIAHVYKSYIGFDVHFGNELKLVTWFLLCIALILLLSFRYSMRKKERQVSAVLIITIIVSSGLTSYGAVTVSTKAFSRADHNSEIEYYMNTEKVQLDLSYEIKSYEITMNDSFITVQMTFSQLDTLNPSFQLYHAFDVEFVQANDQAIDFEREGDIITIYLQEKSDSIVFHYKIVDTYLIPYTNGRVALLADKAWYPKKSSHHIYKVNEELTLLEVTESFNSNDMYDFSLNVDGALFTNLTKYNDSYRGNTQAVTLIKGQGNRISHGDYEILYPADRPTIEDKIPTVISQFEITIDEAANIAPTTVKSLPKLIVLSHYGLSTFMTNDHFVYNTGYPLAIDDDNVTKDFQKVILEQIVPKKGQRKIYDEWIHMTSQYIRDKHDLFIDNPGRSISSFSWSAMEQEQISNLYLHFNSLNRGEKEKFLIEWYEKLDDFVSWEKLMNSLVGSDD